jgi:hypothetical protein
MYMPVPSTLCLSLCCVSVCVHSPFHPLMLSLLHMSLWCSPDGDDVCDATRDHTLHIESLLWLAIHRPSYEWPHRKRLQFSFLLNCLCLQCMPVELLAHITHSLTSLNHSFTDNHRTADPLSRAVSALCHVRSAVHGVHWQTAQFMACTGRQRNSWHAVAVSACRLHKHTSSRTAHRESLCECLSQTYALTAATTTTAAAI